MKRDKLSRRGFFRSALAGAAAASVAEGAAAETDKPKPPPQYSDYLKDKDKGNEVLPLTENNIEGPFYRPGAPFRTRLYEEGDKGDLLVISGTILARNGRPIPGAVLEVWHATSAGRYDNDDPDNPPPADHYHLRASIKADQEGRYEFETLRPGYYKLTATEYRTAHMHFRVSAEGYVTLTSQFFFKGEQYNKTDPWFKPSMVLDLKPDGKKYRATFKLVLAKA